MNHERLPATPVPESRAVMWFHIVSRHDVIREFGGAFVFGLTCDDLNASFVTSVDHMLVLVLVTALGYKPIRDGLIIGPPLRTLDVFLRGTH
jgi:hypothetical protein